MRLVELDAAAQHAGLFIGQSLSDARALVPNLLVREIDRAALAAAFADFADWHSDASPMVALLTDKAAYGDLVLDITGVSHLFGGEAAMLRRLLARLEKLGFTARGAVADSVGAAWALAHFSPGTLVEGDPAGALAGLPVAAYAIGDPTWIAPVLLVQVAFLQPLALAHLDYQRTKDDGGHVPGPARLDGSGLLDVEGHDRGPGQRVRREDHDITAGFAHDRGPEVERGRQRQPAGVVGVVADEVDPPRRPGGDGHACRSWAAASAGSTGFTNRPLPSSPAATYRTVTVSVSLTVGGAL